MSDTSEELVDRVDLNDNEREVKSLGECLRWGLLHRAVGVFIFNSRGLLLIQKRSSKKLWRPGYWTISSTGHVRSGDSYLQAAERELSEEVSISAGLRYLSKYVSPKFRQGDLVEWEVVALFEGRSEGPATPDGDEVEECRWVSAAELSSMTSDREGRVSPDAVSMVNEYRRVRGRL